MAEISPRGGTTAVLLAAGAGTRLGLGPKALLPFCGTTLVAHAAGELLRGGCSQVIVVIGAGADTVRQTSLPSGCTVVVNPRWAEGMGTSFAVGVRCALDPGFALDLDVAPDTSAAVEPEHGVPGPAAGQGQAAGQEVDPAEERAPEQVLVALVDQPGMTARLVARLIAAHLPGRITAAGYRSEYGVRPGSSDEPSALRRGNPVLFSPRHAGLAARSASGDAGARHYLRIHADATDLVDCSDLSDGADLDTPEQLHLLERPTP
ncbi:nucleotidyltransferase family protein [Arthrobacter psychrochitiniphilus]|uniref:Molybdenum cofactor cytidylyltransferase n=1 Tax=Arthrobacter psychrochitiniphilus TaxID=291045 RepID=A0A2V3DPC6_9MICC|nr:nucleotidyltransferase family protein [Arthrobacter psychrochitiniphilus]NYG16959.1 nicotine blue oxidoreductase [Arthrobacter psychrochitiniphilus]PXA64810.1 molybdenum cofactor cytidylyltransferase [Arthrobacter psychrochitiniphilus]